MPEPSGRREVLSDAAIEVIAAHGMRGLTHRAVDASAGVPTGSTSYYFRSRRALLEAVLVRLNALNTADTAPVVDAFARRDGAHENDPFTASELDDLACALTTIFDRWLAVGRHRLLARYACEAEVAQDPELRNLLTSAATLDEQAAQIAGRAGAPDAEARGRNLVACMRGLIYSRVASTGEESAPPPGTPEGQEELYVAVRRVIRAFIPHPDEPVGAENVVYKLDFDAGAGAGEHRDHDPLVPLPGVVPRTSVDSPPRSQRYGHRD